MSAATEHDTARVTKQEEQLVAPVAYEEPMVVVRLIHNVVLPDCESARELGSVPGQMTKRRLPAEREVPEYASDPKVGIGE